MAKKTPPIKLDTGVLPIVTANPNTLVDGALKLAAVGSTILVVKVMLDAVDDMGINDWLQKHPNYVGDFMSQGWFLLGPSGAALEAIYTELPKPWEVGAAVGKTLHDTRSWSEAFKTLLQGLGAKVQAAKSALEMADIYIGEAQALFDEKQQYLIDNPYLPRDEAMAAVAERDAAKDALDARINDKKVLLAKADLERAVAERGRWIVAMVTGTFLATTMIFAGDSVLDLASGALGALGIIPKVV